ncbi:MAG: hypothetical protein HYV15_05490 [Elusimicrobia bacterium]|nr:hypothetical protein [Elusimicrobiota bacterium]
MVTVRMRTEAGRAPAKSNSGVTTAFGAASGEGSMPAAGAPAAGSAAKVPLKTGRRLAAAERRMKSPSAAATATVPQRPTEAQSSLCGLGWAGAVPRGSGGAPSRPKPDQTSEGSR